MTILLKNAGNFWLTISDRYARVGGRVWWQDTTEAPRLVEFNVDWPVLGIRMVSQRRRTHIQTSVQARASSWHAHLPRTSLGIPASFRISASDSRACGQTVGDQHLFDFTGLAPLPSDDLERRAIVLLQEIENFREKHPEVLLRLGIDVNILFKDE